MNIPSAVLDKLCSVAELDPVEPLAQWLHEAMRDCPDGRCYSSWADLGESAQGRYRHVARKMLAERPVGVSG